MAGIGADFESWKDEEKDCFSQQRCAEEADKVYADAKDSFNKENTAYIQAYNDFLDAQAGFLQRNCSGENLARSVVRPYIRILIRQKNRH